MAGFFWGAAAHGIDWAVRRLAVAPPCARCPKLLLSNIKTDPTTQVSDKFAVGTSAAMRYYLSAWEHIATLWEAAESKKATNERILIDERLLYAYMRGASFAFATIAAAWKAEHGQSSRRTLGTTSEHPTKPSGRPYV